MCKDLHILQIFIIYGVIFVYIVDVYHYNTLSDGEKKVYTNEDELKEYGDRGILDPDSVSYYSLYINGVLQPKVNYEIQEGQLTLNTKDVPLKDSPITLAFITIKEKTSTSLNSLQAKGMLPSGQTSTGPVRDLDISLDGPMDFNLKLDKVITSGPKSVYAGQLSQWGFTLTISNIGGEPITNIVVTDNILLDTILSIENSLPSKGIINISPDTIIWTIDTLDGGQFATASFVVTGYFSASGMRFINRTYATYTNAIGPVATDLVYEEPLEVDRGMFITNTIISGPTMVKTGKINTWRIEIKISNFSHNSISDILVLDSLFIENIEDVKIVNISKGNVKLNQYNILWEIDELKSHETSILTLDIRGGFISNGFKNLGTILGVGNISNEIIFSNTAEDFQILVQSASTKVKKGLFVEKNILNQPLAGFIDTFKKWTFSIMVTNTSKDFLENIIITDYMLFDSIDYIKNLSVSSGSISISNSSILWYIDELYPGGSQVASFEVRGLFSTTGPRAINRAFATGFNPKTKTCILSNISSGNLVNVFDPKNDLKETCVVVNKVFSQCQQRKCFESINVYIGEADYKKIIFKPGFIVENSLLIENINDQPNYKRVKLLLKIPFQIITTNDGIIDDYLPNILVDKVMYMPEARDEFLFNINVETSSKPLSPPIKQDRELIFPVGVFVKVSLIGKVQLLIPNYEFPLNYSTIENVEGSIYNIDKLKSILNLHLPHNEKTIIELQGNSCPNIFGKLIIEKHIVSGPLITSSNTSNTWIVELKVTNIGNGPIANVIAIDSLFLDELIDFNVISSSKGIIDRHDKKIIWKIGSLNSYESAVIVAEIRGTFDSKSTNILKGENHQYNTVSDGIKKVYTNYDEIAIYGNLGIPNPNEVSFLNLFVNGVLQPRSNYSVEEGAISLLTDDVPIKGVPIILEYFKIYNKDNQMLEADIYQYNTISKGKKVYTDDDELIEYGDQGILDPKETSYMNLFINGVIQPKVNYSVKEGSLELLSEPLPIEGSPIILQFITFM